MADYIQDAFSRIEAMQKEAVVSLKTDIDVFFWPEQGEILPYFTNRLGPMATFTDGFDEWIEGYWHTVLMRLVVGHITEGFPGGVQDDAHQYIVLTETYFRTHEMLATDTGTYADNGPTFLLTAGANRFLAQLTNHTGLVVFANSGIGAQQVGCEFTLRLPYLRSAL